MGIIEVNENLRSELNNAVLCWLATVSREGVPNVTPKEIFTLSGRDRILIADIASPVSVRNIEDNPIVCVSFIDIFRQRGYKIVGLARIIERSNASFRTIGNELLAMVGDRFRIQNIIEVTMTRVSRIRAPSYQFYPERTEQEIMQDAYRTYGVTPSRGGQFNPAFRKDVSDL